MLAFHYAESSNRTADLAHDARVSLSTVQRILSEETGASVDTLDAVADVFRLAPYQLLLPNLNPADPQIVPDATRQEAPLFSRVRRVSLRKPAPSR